MLNPEQGKGVVMKKIVLSVNSISEVEENILPEYSIDDEKMAVRTMKKCFDSSPEATEENTCGMDIFNGVIAAGFGIYNIKSGELETMPIKSGPRFSIYDFDVIQTK